MAMKNLEKQIISVWQNILCVDEADMESSFFDCGGDSMAAIELINGLRKIGIEVDIDSFYSNPTINMLVQKVNG